MGKRLDGDNDDDTEKAAMRWHQLCDWTQNVFNVPLPLSYLLYIIYVVLLTILYHTEVILAADQVGLSQLRPVLALTEQN